MNTLVKTTLALAVAAASFSSCKKNDNKNLSVNYQLRVENTSSSLGRPMSRTIAWTSGSAFVSKFDFEAELNDDNEVEFESRINRRVDLFSGVSNLGAITLNPGRYEELELDLHVRSTATDTAFVLHGTFTNSSNVTTPVVFFITDSFEFETEVENVTINSVDDFRALTTLDLSRLTFGVTESDLTGATQTGGRILISANQNSSIYSKLLNNLQQMDRIDWD